jgi:hypothetical protein
MFSVSVFFFVPDPKIFPQLEGLKLEADDELIYVFDVDADPATDDSKHPMVSVLITDAFIGEEVKPEQKHHQAYAPVGGRWCIKESTGKPKTGFNLSRCNSQRNSASSTTSPATP